MHKRTPIETVLGRNVAAKRTKLGLSLRELAAQLGWTHMQLHNIEHARKGVPLWRVQALAEAFGCTYAALFRDAP